MMLGTVSVMPRHRSTVGAGTGGPWRKSVRRWAGCEEVPVDLELGDRSTVALVLGAAGAE